MPYRKLSRCNQKIIGILYKIADILNLSEIDYVVESVYDDIDMFQSGIHKLHVRGIKDRQKVKYEAVVKWHGDPQRRQCFRELYRREYVFYKLIVPHLLHVQKRYNIIEGLKFKVCNCIYANIEQEHETLVFLMTNEYQFIDRFHKTDFTHASLVMKNLAKLHALSFVIEKTDPKAYEEIKRQCNEDVQYSDPVCVSKSMACYYNVSVNLVCDMESKKLLQALAPNLVNILHECTKIRPHSVICHADCWNNNLNFKYQGYRPIDVIFIDYQLCRIASPVTDIAYYLYMTSERDFLIENYDHLLQIYYGTLSAVLRQCDLDVEDIFPKLIFQEHLRIFSVFGLIEALVSMKIITAAPEEALLMTETKYYTEDLLPDDVSQNQSLYVERVNGIVKDFFDRGYSLDEILITNK